MSDALLTRRNQPLFAWLLLLLLVLMAVFFLILPAVSKSSELSEQIESGYQRLNKMHQIKLATPEFAAEYDRVRAQGLDKLFYPEGMTVAQVGKELQKQLASVIESRNGIFLSSEVVDEIADAENSHDGFKQVTVQADFRGDTNLLREVLYQSYRSRPLIFVDRLDVRPMNNTTEQQLKATVRVSAYWRGGEDNNETLN